MTPISLGLVCEGKTDFEIVSWCLKKALVDRDFLPTFHPIQPSRDMTSGSYSEGGWRKVYQWCVRNDLQARERFFGGGLFAGPESIALDAILVHVDGDLREILAKEELWKRVSTKDPIAYGDDHLEPRSTLAYCIDVVDEWLNPDHGRPDAKAHFVPTVRQSEAWLLGAIRQSGEPEQLVDPKGEFAKYWFVSKGRDIPDKLKRLKNHHDEVVSLLVRAEPDIENLLVVSPAFFHALAHLYK